MKKYKNIVFDIGNVLMGYRWQEMLTDDYGLDKERVEEFGPRIFTDKLWLEFDRGVMTYEEIVDTYKKKYPKDADILDWFFTNAHLMRVKREDVWELVRKLKSKGYGIYILSNYSKDLLDSHAKDASFWNYVDGKMVSYMVHELKPDLAIYQALFNKYELDPSTCLFLDDRKENVEGSIKAGMDSVVIESKEQLVDLLEELIAC